jgi:hypothetical protein
MNIRCTLGMHDWSIDCRECNRCGKTRSCSHDWSEHGDKCRNCKQENHTWTDKWNRRCTICRNPDWNRLIPELRRANLTALENELLETPTYNEPDPLLNLLFRKEYDRIPVQLLDPFYEKNLKRAQEKFEKSRNDEILEVKRIRKQCLREALQPIAERWEESIEDLLKVVELFDLLNKLEHQKICFWVRRYVDIEVCVDIPGERWVIDHSANEDVWEGKLAIRICRSDSSEERIYGSEAQAALQRLLT